MTRILRHPLLIYLALAVLVAGVYLAVNRAVGEAGYPLDDAWIHQTYARNLGEHGLFAFAPGQPSAGSTAPLWSGLLAVGYALRLEPLAWTYGLGILLLALTAWLTRRLVLGLAPEASKAAWLAGALVVVEWHLTWSAVSGMETLLFAALALVVFGAEPRTRWPPALALSGWLGVAAGLAVFVRPDGLLLLPFMLARAAEPAEGRGARLTLNLLAFGALLAAYLGLNRALGGSIWPNTLYAKQAEYAALTLTPLWTRLGQVGAQPFIGPVALLLPGLAALVVGRWGQRAGRVRRLWAVALPLAWAAGVVGAYALRLPVTYQHGRYLMPVIPVLIAAGVAGLAGWLRPGSTRRGVRVFSRVWVAAVAAVALLFTGLGAQAYARDVQIIQTEMVRTADWVRDNTAPDAVIAAHDIGALGYFGERPILDLAGLVSPEVIGFMRDEAQLRAWLDQQGADYVMTFPGWYPALVAGPQAERVFVTGSPASVAAGGENMAVYRWNAAAGP